MIYESSNHFNFDILTYYFKYFPSTDFFGLRGNFVTFVFEHYWKTKFGSCRLLGDTENAVESLTKAVDILRITHGTTSPFMKELFLKLDEARAEASYKLSSKQDEWNFIFSNACFDFNGIWNWCSVTHGFWLENSNVLLEALKILK